MGEDGWAGALRIRKDRSAQGVTELIGLKRGLFLQTKPCFLELNNDYQIPIYRTQSGRHSDYNIQMIIFFI